MRIAIDLDGVVFNIIDPWIEKYNSMFSDDLKVSDLTSGSLHKFIVPECSEQLLYGPQLLTDGIILTCEMHGGSKEKVLELAGEHEIAFLTSTFPHNRAARTKRAFIEFHNIYFDLIFSYKKENYPFDILIDDSHYNCRRYKERNPNSIVIIVTRPWNAQKPWPDEFRISELKDLDLNKFIDP